MAVTLNCRDDIGVLLLGVRVEGCCKVSSPSQPPGQWKATFLFWFSQFCLARGGGLMQKPVVWEEFALRTEDERAECTARTGGV